MALTKGVISPQQVHRKLRRRPCDYSGGRQSLPSTRAHHADAPTARPSDPLCTGGRHSLLLSHFHLTENRHGIRQAHRSRRSTSGDSGSWGRHRDDTGHFLRQPFGLFDIERFVDIDVLVGYVLVGYVLGTSRRALIGPPRRALMGRRPMGLTAPMEPTRRTPPMIPVRTPKHQPTTLPTKTPPTTKTPRKSTTLTTRPPADLTRTPHRLPVTRAHRPSRRRKRTT